MSNNSNLVKENNPHRSKKEMIVFISVLDFPNGLGNTMRIKMLGKAFHNIGYNVKLLIPYAQGLVSKGLNKLSEGDYDGISFKFCNGSPEPLKGVLSLLYYNIVGPLLVIKEIVRLNRNTKIKYLYLYAIHGTTIYDDILYFLLAKWIKARIIIDVNDTLQRSLAERTDLSLKRFIFRRVKGFFIKIKGSFIISHCNYIFYVSPYLKNQIEKIKKPSIRMLFVPILIDSKMIQGLKRDEQNERKVITYIGNFREYEGLDFLLESIKELVLLYPNFNCYLYGETLKNKYQAQNLKRTINELTLQEQVFVKKSVPHDKLFKILINSDVLVVPRKSSVVTLSGFSQKFGDYLLSGVPVVSTRVGEITNLLQDEEHIFFVDEGNPEEFAQAIYKVLKEKKLAQKVGRKGQKYAVENFDYKVIGARIKNFLELKHAE